MVSRKKAAGKARKAAKAKAEADEKARAQERIELPLLADVADKMQKLPCKHGADSIPPGDISQFVLAFRAAFRECANEAKARGDDFLLSTYLIDAHKATLSDLCGKILLRWKWRCHSLSVLERNIFGTVTRILHVRLLLMPGISSNTSQLSSNKLKSKFIGSKLDQNKRNFAPDR